VSNVCTEAQKQTSHKHPLSNVKQRCVNVPFRYPGGPKAPPPSPYRDSPSPYRDQLVGSWGVIFLTSKVGRVVDLQIAATRKDMISNMLSASYGG
jgi:hypothetical protein